MVASFWLRVDIHRMLGWVSTRWVGLALAILTGWYSLATLPYLADFPTLGEGM